MKFKILLIGFIFAIINVAALANVTGTKTDVMAIGATLDNFSLADSNGKLQSFNDLKGKNGAVIIFFSIKCPVVKGYNDRINKIASDYQAKGVNIIGMYSNADETAEDIKKHADEHYNFPVLIDKGNIIADTVYASATPQVFFFDGRNKLVYTGAIDNNRTGQNVWINYLQMAIDEKLAGKPLTKTGTKAIGCSIQKAAKGTN